MSVRTTDQRLSRLLAMVPWVVARESAPIDEVCARFGYTEAELAEDLEQLFVCGIYPFTPDTLIEADMDDGMVSIRFAHAFSRPLTLTPGEALHLLAAGSAMLAAGAAEPSSALARGLAKLAAVLGLDPDEVIEVELGAAPPEVLATLRDAVTSHHQVEIEYYSFGRDVFATRTIDPLKVFNAAGQWYVSAHCHSVDELRLFRLDRMRAARRLDTTFAPRHAPDPAVFSPRQEDPVVVLDLSRRAAWVAEQYPYESITRRKNGTIRLTLRVSERAWLERLLLRLGPDAKVVKGAEGVAAAAARRVLERYRMGAGAH